jgi:hypothetical protein
MFLPTDLGIDTQTAARERTMAWAFGKRPWN